MQGFWEATLRWVSSLTPRKEARERERERRGERQKELGQRETKMCGLYREEPLREGLGAECAR